MLLTINKVPESILEMKAAKIIGRPGWESILFLFYLNNLLMLAFFLQI
jgi:hypothetical protein